ncbi:MAG: hypothetical protein F6K18_16525 [Okeania sp. SIO2C2]|uniref:hypothetical protein n=1 Tax=Okeania sp. SIO2C2 TaxID=2607787 RepID=UPI0013BC0B53|nr:hypothetical protein [Okeania sp. SIO2C2]NEP88302.1 hypothetical protein [Okeania sp. SIO2C2]
MLYHVRLIRVCAQKSFSRGRRQLYWRQETGGTGNCRGGSRKNCKSDFSAIIAPKH